MASFISGFGLMSYLRELNKKEFMKFKNFLIQDVLELKLKQISWTEVKKASQKDLANFLLKSYGENQAWDMTFKILQKINRKETREIATHPTIYLVHLKKKLTHDCSRKFNISIQNFLQDEDDHLENLLVPKGTEKKPHVVFLKGVAGTCKTIMLKN